MRNAADYSDQWIKFKTPLGTDEYALARTQYAIARIDDSINVVKVWAQANVPGLRTQSAGRVSCPKAAWRAWPTTRAS